jgi:hypothetical protein
MKRKLLSLFALLLSLLMLVLPLASCDNSKDDDDDDEKSGGKGDLTPVADVAEGMLLATLEKNDIKINISGSVYQYSKDIEDLEDVMSSENTVNGTVYIKKSHGVYELVADLRVTIVEDFNGEKYTNNASLLAIIKDGKIYTVNKSDVESDYDSYDYSDYDVEDIGMEINVDQLLEQAIAMYNSELKSIVGIEINDKDDVTALIKRVIATVMTKIDVGFKKDSAGYKLEYKLDEKSLLNKLVEAVVAAEDKQIADAIVSVANAAGVKLTKAQLMSLIDETFVEGLDLTQAIAKIENVLKTITGENVSFKAYFDEVQKNSGLTTKQIIEYLKLTGETDLFTAPNANETIYDYLIRKFGGVLSIDALLEEEMGEGVTLAVIGEEIKAILNSDMTVGEFIVEMTGEPEVTEIFDMITMFKCNSCDGSFLVELNNDYSLEKISFDENVSISFGGEKFMEVRQDFDVTVEYTSVDESVFDLPADFYDNYNRE